MLREYLQRIRSFNRDVWWVLIAWLVMGFTSQGVGSVLRNLHLLRLGYGPEFVGLIGSVSSLAFTACCLPAGALGGRWGSRRSLAAGMAVSAIGGGLYSQAELVPAAWQRGWLLGSTCLTTMGWSLVMVNTITFLVGATSAEDRPYAFSVQTVMLAAGAFLGSLIGGLLPGQIADQLGSSTEAAAPYRWALFVAGLPLVLPAAPLLRGGDDATAVSSRRNSAKGGAPLALILLMSLVVALRSTGSRGLDAFFGLYLDEGLGESTATIGAVTSAVRILSVGFSLAAPLLMARWGERRIVFWSVLGMALSLLPPALLPGRPAAGLAFLGVNGLIKIASPATNLYSQESVAPAWRGLMSGATSMSIGIGAAAMSLSGGYIIAGSGYRALFLTMMSLTGAGALIFWASTRALVRDRPVGTAGAEAAADRAPAEG